MVKFLVYDPSIHRSDFIKMNIAYLNWIRDECLSYFTLDILDILGPIDKYVDNSLPVFESFRPPTSIVYILLYGDTIAGMGCLKQTTHEFSEIKRMYVKPGFRGKGLGKSIINKLLETASEFGHKKLRLDTGPFMQAAQNVYKNAGFYEIKEYPEAEVPQRIRFDWMFMEKIL